MMCFIVIHLFMIFFIEGYIESDISYATRQKSWINRLTLCLCFISIRSLKSIYTLCSIVDRRFSFIFHAYTQKLTCKKPKHFKNYCLSKSFVIQRKKNTIDLCKYKEDTAQTRVFFLSYRVIYGLFYESSSISSLSSSSATTGSSNC